MNINIGENIKNLRKKKEITQEELAEHLGISFQSISKWERGDGYPDIAMLPDIADFFNISVDDLLGADRIPGGAVNNIYMQAHEYEINGDYGKAAELLRDVLKKEPYHYDLTSKFASVLLLLDPDSEEGKNLHKKALAICERHILDKRTSEKSRATARAMVCFLYDNIGERENAVYLARNLPHVWESREVLWGELMEGQEYIEYLKSLILKILSIISGKIDRADGGKINIVDMLFFGGGEDIINPQNKREIVEKIVGFLD